MSRLDRQLESLANKLGIKRKVHLDVVDGPVGPAVFGFLRPRIVLPQAIVENQTAQQLEPLLAHELIHLRRGDLWWSALQMISTCVFLVSPVGFGWRRKWSAANRNEVVMKKRSHRLVVARLNMRDVF